MNDSLIFTDDVDQDRVANEISVPTTAYIRGSDTVISPGSVLGEEGPVVLENCQVGRGVRLKGGYYRNAVFLDGSSMGSGAHIREGTLVEEQASGAHSVGLKQTILFPFVTAGSLINFCDALIAGGTSRKDHSEIGSSFVHFNYTPSQDKATASLFGDVEHGVFLRERPVFLGGQSGAVGPLRVAYGTALGAGSILRHDQLEPNRLIIPDTNTRNVALRLPLYRNLKRILDRNIGYIAQLMALREWYGEIRLRCVRDAYDQAVYEGAVELLSASVAERLHRLNEVIKRVAESHQMGNVNALPDKERKFQADVVANWKAVDACQAVVDHQAPTELLSQFDSQNEYIESVQQLPLPAVKSGQAWLRSIIISIEKSMIHYE